MNLLNQKDSLYLRRKDLQRQIFEALNLDNRELFSSLQSQWVHRFGLETLPDEKELQNLFGVEEISLGNSLKDERLLQENNLNNEKKNLHSNNKSKYNEYEKNQVEINQDLDHRIPNEAKYFKDENIKKTDHLDDQVNDIDRIISPDDDNDLSLVCFVTTC